MRQFVNRELEMRTLEQEHAKKDVLLVIVYGGRCMGKTTVYFPAAQEAESINRNQFREKAA